MAQTRMEKIGTIFYRVKGMLKAGAMKPEHRPIWYDVYEAFPPEQEPRMDRECKPVHVRPILYREDNARARFSAEYKRSQLCTLFERPSERSANSSAVSIQQQLVDKLTQLRQLSPDSSDTQLFGQAVESLKSDGVLLVDLASGNRNSPRRNTSHTRSHSLASSEMALLESEEDDRGEPKKLDETASEHVKDILKDLSVHPEDQK